MPPPPPERASGDARRWMEGQEGRAGPGLPEGLELGDGVGGGADAGRGATEPPRGEEAVGADSGIGADGLLSVGTHACVWVGGRRKEAEEGTADAAARGGWIM